MKELVNPEILVEDCQHSIVMVPNVLRWLWSCWKPFLSLFHRVAESSSLSVLLDWLESSVGSVIRSGGRGSGSWKSSCILVNLSCDNPGYVCLSLWRHHSQDPSLFLPLSFNYMCYDKYVSVRENSNCKIPLISVCDFSFCVAYRLSLLWLFWRLWLRFLLETRGGCHQELTGTRKE